jgi:glycosyltransferase involved in cell wall biosynthesis
MNAPDVSVVVPTRDRPAALERCLRALSGQTLNGTLEIIVVDDGSRRSQAVAAVARAFPGVRLIRTERAGPAAARNLGASVAGGAIVCMTDDDCEPAPDWSERLATAIRTGADASAGVTLAAASSGGAALASQLIARFLMDRSRGQGSRLSFAPSNNIACRREVLAELPFDPTYPAAAAEDRDWCARLVGAGYTLVAERHARVLHVQGCGLWAFSRRHFRYGRGAERYRSAHHAAGRREPLGFYLALVREGFRRGPVVGALICLSQATTAAGRLREALGAHLAPSIRRSS